MIKHQNCWSFLIISKSDLKCVFMLYHGFQPFLCQRVDPELILKGCPVYVDLHAGARDGLCCSKEQRQMHHISFFMLV